MGIVAIDFFSGCGGTTRGFLDAGIKVLKGIDIDPACGATYSYNNRSVDFVLRDICKMRPKEVLDGLRLKKGDHLLLSGCAPCQPFSKQNKNRAHDPRRSLLCHFGRMVKTLKPEFVFVENVPGIQNIKGNSSFKRFVNLLDQLRYNYEFQIVDAKFYGVPQSRKRLILIASRSFKISFPQVTHGNEINKLPVVTVADAIKVYPPISAGDKHPVIPNHEARGLSPLNLKRLQFTRFNGGDRRNWPSKLWLACHSKSYAGHTDVYGRMAWNKPAPALTCRCTSLSNGRYGHPEQDRAISIREAAALQTFPDDFVFLGNKEQASSHVGNAVPVKLAQVFGNNFMSCVKRDRKSK